mmetsp:Transcript_56199/g.133436  ORF Transcript_56199/g.133436 Transcript_56199/m.133436 type:complete len:338 (-) Transcript_56199:1076-2089(-)
MSIPATYGGVGNLVDLDRGVDRADERERRQEAQRAGDEEDAEGDDEHVPDVHNRRHRARHLELEEGVVDRIEEDVHGARPAREERPPPPVVVLAAQLEVAHHNRDLGASEEEDDEDEEEEAEEVVELVQPDGGQHVEHLHEHRAEGEDAADEDVEERVHEPRLLRYLARDLVGADGELDGLLAEPEVGACHHQRRRDAQPHAEEGEEGAEGHGARRLLPPDEQVQHEEDRECEPREEHGGPEGVALPARPLEHAEHPRGGVPPHHAHKHEQEQHRLHERAAVGGREEPKARKQHQERQRDRQLDAGTDEDREPPGEGGRAEHVTVHQLPAGLLLAVL